MKVLIFTHKSDIDGMGGAVLAKLAFKDVRYDLCETFNLDDEILRYYNSGEIYNYDMVYVTDLCPSEFILEKVLKDNQLNNKFLVFDHHKTIIKEGLNKYTFTNIMIEDENGKSSGTSLFYKYLTDNNYLGGICVSEFVELTRRYDTWEWKNKYNDEKAHELTLLFNAVGPDGYIKMMSDKLTLNGQSDFEYTELERMLIENKKEQLEEKLSFYSKKLFYKKIFGLKAGIVFIDYEYRNDLAEYLRVNNFDMDFVMMIALDYGTISYRNVKPGINVREIAEKFGGKGHDYAASSPIFDEQKEEMIKVLTKKN